MRTDIIKIYLILFTVFSEFILAQSVGSVKGFVVDSSNSEVLANCNIYLKEIQSGTTTNDRGYFFISSVPGNRSYTLRVSYIGYETEEIIIDVYQDRITEVNIKLKPVTIELGEIEKIGEKYTLPNTTDISLERIFYKQLELIPKNVESDLFRTLQNIAGVTSTGDVSARYFVRGGSSDQNLVLLNDVPVYSPFHSLGMFSVIDPDIINFAEFYKSGFPLEYNGGLSSLIRVITKDGNKNKYSLITSVGLLTAKAQLEGPIPNGSFIISGRKSYSTDVLRKFMNNNDVPVDFYDLSAKVSYANQQVVQDAKFTLHAFISNDELTNSDPLREDFSWSNQIYGFKYFQWVSESPIFYEFSLSQSIFSSEVIPKFLDSSPMSNELEDFTVKGDLTYIFPGKDELGLGIKFINIKTELSLENVRGIPVVIQAQGTNVSTHLKYKLLRYDKFLADFGTRINFTRLAAGTAGQMSFEPRVNLSYRIIDPLTIKGSVGRYEQELKTLTDENEIVTIFEPWIITPKYLTPQRAVHYVLGTEVSLTEAISLKIEGYYKELSNISGINQEKYFPEDPDLVAGSGEAYGVEFTSVFSDNKFYISGNYSFNRAFRTLNGITYPPRYDARHTVDLSISYAFFDNWRIGASWSFTTGLPFTQIAGYYSRLYFQDLGSRNYIFLPFTILSQKNLGRLPDYHRLDISLSKSFTLYMIDFLADVSIINVYDRQNLFYFDVDKGNRVNMLPFLLTASLRAEI
ncbi:MAG: TonB-dependent receptor [Ignavibacteriaceae bacterium]